MVIFGAPDDMSPGEQGRRAASCALAMQKALVELNSKWAEDDIEPLEIRVGIHHGPAIVGNFGSAQRLDYTAIGDTVNLASRIESHGEAGQILVSGMMADLLPEKAVEKAGAVELKGIEGTTRLYRVLPEAAGALKDGEVAA